MTASERFRAAWEAIAAYAASKHAFDEAGIEIPFPHMKVVLPEGQISELVRH